MIHSLKTFTILSTAILLLASCNKNPLGSAADKGRVVFISNEDYKLYTQNLDGGNRKRIHIRDFEDNMNQDRPRPVYDEIILNMGSPRWSPDGKKIALVVGVAYDQSQLIVMDANGRNAKAASPNTQMVFAPDWSPDGSKIVYSMSTSFWGTFSEIFITDLETDIWQQLTHLSTQVGNLVSPRWSEDGSKIFFTNGYPDSLNNIYVYSFESDTVEITETWRGTITSFSRDGNGVFGFKLDGNIYNYSLKEEQEKILTNGQGPRLIDLDRQILFIRGRYPNYSNWLMTTEGSDIRSIDSTGEFVAGQIDIYWK